MEIKAYGLNNHPDISSFYDDYGVDSVDDLFDAFGNRADELGGIKFTYQFVNDDPNDIELHVFCDYGDNKTLRQAVINFLAEVDTFLS